MCLHSEQMSEKYWKRPQSWMDGCKINSSCVVNDPWRGHKQGLSFYLRERILACEWVTPLEYIWSVCVFSWFCLPADVQTQRTHWLVLHYLPPVPARCSDKVVIFVGVCRKRKWCNCCALKIDINWCWGNGTDAALCSLAWFGSVCRP